jgi:hypothetical protein
MSANLQTTKQKHIWHNRTDILVHKLATLSSEQQDLAVKCQTKVGPLFFCSWNMHKCSVSLSKDEEDNFLITFGRCVKEYEILGTTVTARDNGHTAILKDKLKKERAPSFWHGKQRICPSPNSAYVHLQTNTINYYLIKREYQLKTRPSKPVTVKNVQACHTRLALSPLVINFQIYSNNNNTK